METNDNFVCRKCDRHFVSEYTLERHNLRFHTKLKCTNCSRTFSSKKSLISHQKSCLKNESVQDNICSKCGSSFTLKRNLIRHENRESCKRKLVEDINYGSNDTDHISRAKKLNTDLNEQINSTQAECEVDQSITTPIIYDEPTQI
jgi:uncharacterized Zn-finger protein